jgi:hypothetical protein
MTVALKFNITQAYAKTIEAFNQLYISGIVRQINQQKVDVSYIVVVAGTQVAKCQT